jgi:hypothetical protein
LRHEADVNCGLEIRDYAMPFVTEDGNRVESSPPKRKSVRPARSSSPLAFLLGVLIAAGLWTIVFVIWIEPLQSHGRWFTRVDKNLLSLVHMRPAGVSKGEWEYIVGWTLNLHGNCANVGQRLEREWRDGFAAEVERRLRGPITLGDIDWIWDEYVLHTPYGRRYSDRWRPTRAEKLQQAHEGCCGIPVD